MSALAKAGLAGITVVVISYALIAYASNAASEARSFTGAWGKFSQAARGE